MLFYIRTGKTEYLSLRSFQILLLLSVVGYSVAAQTTPPDAQTSVTIAGRIIDMWDHTAIPGVSIINPKIGQSQASMTDGTFSISCSKRDTLFLFLSGYKTLRFSMADSAARHVYHVDFEFERLNTGLSRPVIIQPKPKLSDIEKERAKMGRIPIELQQPDIPLTSPISALYELLSNRAHERAKLREQILDDERRRIYRELFDYYKEVGLFDLPADRYEQFITYLGLPVDFLKRNTDYTITKTILDAYKKFGLERGFIK
jgi:hypothetical protein